MTARGLLFTIFGFGFFSSSMCICPRRVTSGPDRHNVIERFNKFRSAHPTLAVTHTHQRTSKTDTYNYKVTICPSTMFEAAVTQIDEKQKETIIGNVSHATIAGGEDWIMVFYPEGKKYGSHCNQQKRQTWLLIECERENRPMALRVVEENRWQNGDKSRIDLCYYMMEVNHESVCSKIPKKLSGGSIFCIILVSLLGAYLVFGLLYMRFIAGAKGFEQIPHYNFWREVGNLSADGCDFVCRRPNHPANTYKGMADALNIDSSDDEKDDHLLPM